MKKLSLNDVLAQFAQVHGNYYNYSLVRLGSVKVKIICPYHGEFDQRASDHKRGHGCKLCGIEINREQTCNNSAYMMQKFKEKYGVDNPGQLESHKEMLRSIPKEQWNDRAKKRRITNLERYGYTTPSQHPDIKKKGVDTKIKNGSFTKANSSNEATKAIQKYIKERGYVLDQVAYADSDNFLYEWGYYYKDKWYLFDLVVFELGFRGNKDKIIEILEYQGPFHYTKDDVDIRGNDVAYPWKSNKTTIKESYKIDITKKELALMLCGSITYAYPGGTFSVERSENRII